MPKPKTGLQPGYRCLNYAKTNVKINPDEIPNLIPKDYLKEWQKGDPDPYYKVQEIEYPIKSNGLNYQESFFKSFISKLKNRAMPGAKNGHEIYWGVRPDTDFIMIGAKIESNGDGTGKVYFKNYIPPEGEKGSNENFIRENKTDMVHYSLVTYPKEETITDDEGNQTINIIKSLKGERNDAVEYGLGGMKQITNLDDENSLDDLSGQASNFTDPKDNNRQGEDNLKEKEEIFKKLIALKANAEITLVEIAEAMGLKNQVVTNEQIEALKIVNSIKKLGFKDPVPEIKALQETITTNAEAVLNAQLDKEFGTNPDSDSKENYLRKYAGQQIANMESNDFEVLKNNLEKDPIALKFAKDKADYNSDVNKIGVIETSKNKQDNQEVRNDYVVYNL